MRMIHSVVIREKPPSKRPRKQSSLIMTGMITGAVSELLKLSTVSAVTTDEVNWFHCMIVRG